MAAVRHWARHRGADIGSGVTEERTLSIVTVEREEETSGFGQTKKKTTQMSRKWGNEKRTIFHVPKHTYPKRFKTSWVGQKFSPRVTNLNKMVHGAVVCSLEKYCPKN